MSLLDLLGIAERIVNSPSAFALLVTLLLLITLAILLVNARHYRAQIEIRLQECEKRHAAVEEANDDLREKYGRTQGQLTALQHQVDVYMVPRSGGQRAYDAALKPGAENG